MELKRYLEIISRRWPTLFLITFAIVALAIILSLIVNPVYMFHSSVWIRPHDAKATLISGSLNDLASLGVFDNTLVMYSQLSLSKHPRLIQDVITNLDLRKRNGEPFGIPELFDTGTLSIITNKCGLRTRILQNTQFIQIEGFSISPQTAADIANQMAAGYADLCTQLIREKAKEALRFIQENIPQISARLRAAEAKLADYKMKNHLSDASYLREQLLESLVNLKDLRDENERQITGLEDRIKQIRKQLDGMPEFQKANTEYDYNPTLGYLMEKIMESEADFARLKVRLTEDHTAVQETKEALAKLRKEYRKQVTKIFQSETTTRNSYFDDLVKRLGDSEIERVALSVQGDLLLNHIQKKQAELDQLTEKETMIEPVVREVTTLRDTLTDLMSREQLARLASNIDLTTAIVIDRAVVPVERDHLKLYRWFPKRRLIVSMAFLFSLVLGLAVILLQEYFDDTLHSEDEAKALLGTDVLATLPKLAVDANVCIPALMAWRNWSQLIWSITLVLQRERSLPPQTIAVTSTEAGEGKSLVAGSLGQAFASRGFKVLMVEANFSHPSLELLWQLPEADGLGEVLTGAASLRECMRRVGPEELYLLSAGGKLKQTPPPIGDQDALDRLLSLAKGSFDIILLDLESIEDGYGAIVSLFCDQTIIVVAANRVSLFRIKRAIESCERSGGRISGLVLNTTEDHRFQLNHSQIFRWLSFRR